MMETLTNDSGVARRPARFLPCVVIAVYTLCGALSLGSIDRVRLWVCPFRFVTGLPCPGCGMTHAFVALGHGDLSGAWHYNALSVPLYALGMLWLMGRLTGYRVLPALSPRAEGGLLVSALAVTLAYGAYRILVPAARPF